MKGLRAVPKHKNVKLSGKDKTALRDCIFARDKGQCVICKRPAKAWHHQPFGSDKSDELEKGVALCTQCHTDLHSHPKLGSIYQRLVKDYLCSLYGEGQG